MKKVALVFVVAVFVPSLVLAWLALRSLRDQQFLLERQQSLLYQGVADTMAVQVHESLVDCQRSFGQRLAALIDSHDPREVARSFDSLLRRDWPLAQVGFAVTLSGQLLSPASQDGAVARKFVAANGGFLANRESVEVYQNQRGANLFLFPANPDVNWAQQTINNSGQDVRLQSPQQPKVAGLDPPASSNFGSQMPAQGQNDFNAGANRFNVANTLTNYRQAVRTVVPQSNIKQANTVQNENPAGQERLANGRVAEQQQLAQNAIANAVNFNNTFPEDNTSKLIAAPAEFRQLIGDEAEGALARFVDNKLNVLFWRRPPADPGLIFGAQLALPRLQEELRPLLQRVDPSLANEICVALLDDTAKPVAQSRAGFQSNWKRPFVATEIGEMLPHWEVAVYLLDPAKLTKSAETVKLTLGLLIAVLVLAIGVGSWLIVADLNRQLTLARQKTDFVSNVSHELKTPLTSIRMFSELLAEGRVADPAKQRSYLAIISAETARLTRLINNVLDFARLERGEKRYHFQPCDVASVAREAAESYHPHLESNGFRFECELPPSEVLVNGDRDALAQVIVNLLSNAEKYSGDQKDISLQVESQTRPLPYVEVKVLDRGLGVPGGSEEKIFEKFYRAHDSLGSGIQGSGLGLTLARQIARAHGGEVVYERRPGGGSCFSLHLPMMANGRNASSHPYEDANSDCRR
jgi:signal transduction histidine kinase